MFDIVTAKQGKPHVTAEQQARINASAFGPGRYILDVGDGLALSMADANTLTIGSGAIMADGRVIDNEEAVTVAIANGSQAAYRRDLVVYSIETDASTGITTGELSVLQGATATTESAAKDPSYTAGNLLDGDLKATVPIARVKLAALTPTVEPLLSKVPNIASLRDSVYQATNSLKTKDITVSITGLNYGAVFAKRSGNVVVIDVVGAGVKSSVSPWTWSSVIAKIPKQHAPNRQFFGAVATDQGVADLRITETGEVSLFAKSTTIEAGHNVDGQLSYIVG